MFRPAVLVLRPVVDEQQETRGGEAVDQAIEQGLSFRIDPVQILEHYKQGLNLALAQQQPLDGIEGPFAPLVGLQLLPFRVFEGPVQEGQKDREEWLERSVQSEQLPRDLLLNASPLVPVVDPEVGLKQVDHGEVRCGLAVGNRATLERQPAVSPMRMRHLPHEARLADSRFSHDRDHVPLPRSGSTERLVHRVQLALAPHELGQPPRGRRMQSRSTRTSADDLVHVDGSAESLDGHRAEGLDADVTLSEAECRGGEPDAAGSCQLLHASRQVRCLTNGGVVHAQVRADRADHDLAGVETDPDRKLDPVAAAYLLGVATHAGLQVERGVAGPDPVILVGDRRSEQRHDPVPHHLVHRALVAVHRLHHAFDHGIEQLPRLLRIAVREQLHRRLEVGEEHGDLLALALESTPGREDLVCEVLRCVGVRAGKRAWRRAR